MSNIFRILDETRESVNLLNEIEIRLHDNPTILFDDSVEVPSVGNRIKEFNCGEPMWEDMSDEDLCLDELSKDDLSNLLFEIERQIEKDDKLMDKCRGGWY